MPWWTMLLWLLAAALSIWLLARLSALEPRPRLIHLQLAGSSERAELVIREWTAAEREHVRLGISLDYVFIPAYAVVIIGLCLWGSRRFPTLRRTGMTLAWGTGLAAVLDLIENWALTHTLEDPSSGSWPTISAAVAWPKFFILVLALAYGLALSGTRVWRAFQAYLRRLSHGPPGDDMGEERATRPGD